MPYEAFLIREQPDLPVRACRRSRDDPAEQLLEGTAAMGTSPGHARLVSPTMFPDGVRAVFEELTGERADGWALEATVGLSRFRKRHSRSPSFAEFFDSVMALPGLGDARAVDWGDVPGPVLYSLRHHIAVDWRRRGWITWSRLPGSLRQGAAFGAASRQWRAGLPTSRSS